MKRLTMIFFLLSGALLFSFDASSQSAPAKQGQLITVVPAEEATAPKIDPAKEKDIRKLLELTHAGAGAVQTMRNMEGTLRPILQRSLPAGEYRERLLDLFFEKFNSKISGDQMVDLIVPVYDKYYSAQEIKDLIAFYQTPTGQKMSSVQLQLANELQKSGEAFGGMMGRQTMLEVLEEHPDIKQALDAAKQPTLPQ